MDVKKCFKCGELKPLTEFYTHPGTADGFLNKCKACTRKDTRNHELNSPASVLKSRIRTCKKKPTGVNARRVVEAAINAGELTRPDPQVDDKRRESQWVWLRQFGAQNRSASLRLHKANGRYMAMHAMP